MDYLKNLNNVQRNAVESINGPSMVIAGAGSGKTRVLTYKIAHLIKQGINPFNILSLTFTNKAAREMKERITEIIGGPQAQNLWMGTFHSIFAKLLRIEADKLGYSSSYTIYSNDDTKLILGYIIKEKNLDKDLYKPKIIQHRISQLKNNLICSKDYLENENLQQYDHLAQRPEFGNIFKTYENRCFKSGAMDFDDLLINTHLLLNSHPEILKKYQHLFQYILIDEYQDTNHTQYAIIQALASLRENICVVGDDAQSIYAFRGADVKNILNFNKDYSDATIFKLEQNYRSSKTIVNAANSLIKNNINQIHKDIWTENQNGEKIQVLKALTDNEEGLMIANSIQKKITNNQLKGNQFAILYRMNYQSRSIEEALRKKGIKYKIYGGLSFYQRKEVKDLLAYLRLTINHNDEEAFRRIINYPTKGIGTTSIERLIVTGNKNDLSIWEVCEQINKLETGIKSGAKKKIEDFIIKIKSFASLINEMDAHDLTFHIAKESKIMQELHKDGTPEGVSRHDNLQELLNSIKEYSEKFISENNKPANISNFLEDVALLTSLDEKDEKTNNHVSLMTVHLAKGLEFPHVYIIGMEEHVFPALQMSNTKEKLEEERRLFYVALTRAMETATLSLAESRYQWGKMLMAEPSRFINEIDNKYLEFKFKPKKIHSNRFSEKIIQIGNPPQKKTIPKGFKKIKSSNNTIKTKNTLLFLKINDKVSHEKFGIGCVTFIEGINANTKATILFKNYGKKKLLLKFAKLQVLK